jgi:hypothetical protein
MLTFKKRVAVGDALPCRAVNIPPDPETSLPTGKIPVGLLADLLSELPSSPPELLLGPRIGEDACAIRVPGGVLVAATDPITLTSDQIGRFSVIVNANDVAVMGVRPQWFLAVVLVPAGTTRMDRRAKASRPARPTTGGEVLRKVDPSGSISFAGSGYRVNRIPPRQAVRVAVASLADFLHTFDGRMLPPTGGEASGHLPPPPG